MPGEKEEGQFFASLGDGVSMQNLRLGWDMQVKKRRKRKTPSLEKKLLRQRGERQRMMKPSLREKMLRKELMASSPRMRRMRMVTMKLKMGFDMTVASMLV